MNSSESSSEPAEALTAIGHCIRHLFTLLVIDSSALETEYGFRASLVNESQRFGLWAKNIGLYDSGHSSLDYRFRDAPSAYEYARQLLGDLKESLSLIKNNMNHQAPEPNPQSTLSIGRDDGFSQIYDSHTTAETMDGNSEDSESGESSEEDESCPSYQQDSISTIVLGNAKLIIDRLYKLSFKIRDPATRFGFSEARDYCEIDKDTGVDLMDLYTSLDLRHVTEVFARYWQRPWEECENHYLVQRLAKAKTYRRRQFGQWQKQKLKLGRSIYAPTPSKSTRSSAQPTPDISKREFSHDGSLSVLTASNFVTLSEDQIRIPPLPKKLRANDEFECPYCRIVCTKRFANKLAWERHVFKDLRPYVCTYEDCREAHQQYDNMKDWVSHENSQHRETKQQMPSSSEQSSEPFSPSQDPRRSLSQTGHPNPRGPDDIWREDCPICLEKNPNLSHVALHLRNIAIIALPKSTRASEDRILGDPGLNIAFLEDQSSAPSQSSFEGFNEDKLDGDKVDDSLMGWNTVMSKDVRPIKKTGREDAQRSDHGSQGVKQSSKKGVHRNVVVASRQFFAKPYQ